MISFGIDRGKLTHNHAAKGKRLYKSDRTDKLWQPEHIKAFMAVASPELQLALVLALYTGQRQGDLLSLAWGNYDGKSIRLRQSKTARRVTITCGPTLTRILSDAPRRATVILTTPTGRAWKPDHFRHEWKAASKAAGIPNLHFHDLRGTAVTIMSEQGATPQEIATITGWSYASVETILEVYSSRTSALSTTAALRHESALARTFGNQILQTSCKPETYDS